MFKIFRSYKKKTFTVVTADYEMKYRRQMQGFIR